MNQPRIVIVDYSIGNTYSVLNALKTLGYNRVKISSLEEDINNADSLILPGVGSFAACIGNLRKKNLDIVLSEAVLEKKKPILGICVGMQMMATVSEENGVHRGLDWVPGSVRKLETTRCHYVPHVGWNTVRNRNKHGPFFSTNNFPSFYFDHSYHFECDEQFVTAECDYGMNITAAIRKDNMHGVQFHPEKSQKNGLILFRDFFNSIY